MALTERTILGKIEVLETGEIQVREDTIIQRDGKEISRTYHRRSYNPDDNPADLPAGRLRTIAESVWDQTTRDDYQLVKEERARNLPPPTLETPR